MRITTKRETRWIELFPSLAIGWYSGKTLYVGWLFWNVVITF